MNISEPWLSFLAQVLLRGAGWLLFVMLIARLLRRVSAARRSVVWQMAFLGLVMLPPMLLFLPPLPLIPANLLPGKEVRLSSSVLPRRLQPDALISSIAPGTSQPVIPHRSVAATPSISPSDESNSPAFTTHFQERGTAFSHEQARTSALISSEAIPDNKPYRGVPRFRIAGVERLLFLGWGMGALWNLFGLIFSAAALHRLAHGTMEAPARLVKEHRKLVRQLALRSDVRLRMAVPQSIVHAPITWGVFRPVVMMPVDYAGETEGHIRTALLHELAHIKRGDWAWLLLAQIVCALYWCVPLAWIVARGLRREAELACDDYVLANGIPASDYADQLLEATRRMKAANAQLPISVLTMARSPLTQVRIHAILDARRRRQPASRSVLVLAALLPTLVIPVLALRAVAARKAHHVSYYSRPAAPETAMPMPLPLEMTATPALAAAPVFEHAPPASGLALRNARPDLDRLVEWQTEAGTSKTNGNKPHLAAPPTIKTTVPAPASTHGNTPASPEPAMRPIAWGPVVDGLQAGLRLVEPHATFAPDDPIWQEAYLRNRSASEVVVSSIGGYEEQGDPIVTSASGAKLKVVRYFGMGAMITVNTRVRPGEIALIGRYAIGFRLPVPQYRLPEIAPGLSYAAQGMALVQAGPGSYFLRQEVTPFSLGDNTRKSLTTGTIRVEITSKPAVAVSGDRNSKWDVTFTRGSSPPHIRVVDSNQIVDLSHAPIAWGPARSGLQAGLMTVGTRSHYFVGERVRLAVVLRNVSNQPISFWHETSFAFLEAPEVVEAAGTRRSVTSTHEIVDDGGKRRVVMPVHELEWRVLNDIRMTGVTYDMTFAPSADGPSRLRRSEIKPEQATLGYYLTAFIVPSKWSDSHTTLGQYQVIQPIRLGLGEAEQLDTALETGGLNLELQDPDAPFRQH